MLLNIVNTAAVVLAAGTMLAFARQLSQEVILAILVVLISNLGTWVGGYSLLAYPAIVPTLYAMRGRWLYLTIILAVFLPLDGLLVMAQNIGEQNVFLSGAPRLVDWQLSVGNFLRPSLNFLLLVSLAIELFMTHAPAFLQRLTLTGRPKHA